MGNLMHFGDVLEAIDKLSLDEQETLVDVLHKRLIERRREKLAKDIEDAQEEFLAGRSKPATPEKIKNEILS
ncbi:MAG: hypothetical protein JRI95_15320 [Deltaproteobacteria bacterium]|nr:hypothetical protein [Deltaproteobacteria bacterium]MBW2086255.1 hypothetical protein [Deltaproteobacteria bacterium]